MAALLEVEEPQEAEAPLVQVDEVLPEAEDHSAAVGVLLEVGDRLAPVEGEVQEVPPEDVADFDGRHQSSKSCSLFLFRHGLALLDGGQYPAKPRTNWMDVNSSRVVVMHDNPLGYLSGLRGSLRTIGWNAHAVHDDYCHVTTLMLFCGCARDIM